MVKAAVLNEINKPLEIRTDVEVDSPHPGEIKVRIGASGVCHSDVSVQNGSLLGFPPMVLGHEGAGTVEEIGDGVTGFDIGDHIIISWVPQCGTCFFCRRGQPQLCETGIQARATRGLLDGTTRITSRGQKLTQMGAAGTFSETTVIPAIGAVKIPQEFDLKLGALIGCGVLTGVGAALHTAHIEAGDAVAVVGCGGVGLNTIQGARIAGAGQIIAVDTNVTKLAMATSFGATATVDASQGDPVSRVRELTAHRGADVAFEIVGLASTIVETIAMTRRGGQAVLVGVPDTSVMLNVPAFDEIVLAEKSVKGSWYGSSDVRRDIPRLIEYYKSGELMLDELVSRVISLDEVNDAFEFIKMGEVARTVIEF